MAANTFHYQTYVLSGELGGVDANYGEARPESEAMLERARESQLGWRRQHPARAPPRDRRSFLAELERRFRSADNRRRLKTLLWARLSAELRTPRAEEFYDAMFEQYARRIPELAQHQSSVEAELERLSEDFVSDRAAFLREQRALHDPAHFDDRERLNPGEYGSIWWDRNRELNADREQPAPTGVHDRAGPQPGGPGSRQGGPGSRQGGPGSRQGGPGVYAPSAQGALGDEQRRRAFWERARGGFGLFSPSRADPRPSPAVTPGTELRHGLAPFGRRAAPAERPPPTSARAAGVRLETPAPMPFDPRGPQGAPSRTPRNEVQRLQQLKRWMTVKNERAPPAPRRATSLLGATETDYGPSSAPLELDAVGRRALRGGVTFNALTAPERATPERRATDRRTADWALSAPPVFGGGPGGRPRALADRRDAARWQAEQLQHYRQYQPSRSGLASDPWA